MNVLDTSSHGERPICQIWYASVKANRSYRSYMKTWQKPLNLTLRSKALNRDHECTRHIVWWWYIHVPNMVSQCQSKKKVMGRTQKHVKNSINLTLRSKFKVVSGSWMYATHHLMVIHPCAKYGKPMSNHKKVIGRTRICTGRRTDRQTYRQSDSYIPPWTSFAGGIKSTPITLSCGLNDV